jgi:thiosulfate reductase cytochrome b subunit
LALAFGKTEQSGSVIRIHPLTVRITHWINALAVLVMVTSGWRIYDASPLFAFVIPPGVTLGGWLAGALLWHFAAMWVLAINGVIYLAYGFSSGHFRRTLLPFSPTAIIRDLIDALRGRLPHELGVYNAVQRLAYLGVIGVLVALVLSGLSLWKPVQLQGLAALMGGYEGARLVHFFAMCLLVVFVVVHVGMVILVPRTFLPMWSGRARVRQPSAPAASA